MFITACAADDVEAVAGQRDRSEQQERQQDKHLSSPSCLSLMFGAAYIRKKSNSRRFGSCA
jgi:hypothetical protein